LFDLRKNLFPEKFFKKLPHHIKAFFSKVWYFYVRIQLPGFVSSSAAAEQRKTAMLLEINPHNPQQRLIDRAVQSLKVGGVLCYPTDTGYGIGCDLFNQKAIKRIIQLKKRPKQKPFSFMCADLSDISRYAHVSNTAYRLLRKNLPGPYTFVLPGTKLVPKTMATKQKTVGIKVPEHPISRLLIDTLANPIVNTSAQLNEDDDLLAEPYEIEQYLGQRIDIIIDGGAIYPDPSSVIDLTSDSPEILRQGKGDVTPFR
jgi:tRNA threonylcarbamoyl adenosine modification protein (Sua5/YciO/YrdC/YwlC family)